MARADELCTYLIGTKSRLLLALSYLEALHPKAIKLIEYYYIVRGRIIPILEHIFPPIFALISTIPGNREGFSRKSKKKFSEFLSRRRNAFFKVKSRDDLFNAAA